MEHNYLIYKDDKLAYKLHLFKSHVSTYYDAVLDIDDSNRFRHTYINYDNAKYGLVKLLEHFRNQGYKIAKELDWVKCDSAKVIDNDQ